MLVSTEGFQGVHNLYQGSILHTATQLIHKLLYICFNRINLQIHSELNFCQQKFEQQLKNIHLTSKISGPSCSKGG